MNEMPEFYMVLVRKISKYPDFDICPKINKITEFYTIFARKMPKFYIIIARKIFFPNFGGMCPLCPPFHTPMVVFNPLLR